MTQAYALGAAGVGLYRTEFLFLQQRSCRTRRSSSRPTAMLVLGMNGRPVTIRTLDLGADKADKLRAWSLATNPIPPSACAACACRWRASAACSDTQLRAMLRATNLRAGARSWCRW
ncbi:MAG: hypothetical protein LKM39_00455 [Chiayiivirga sp.]|nr:hypothetical protein [Chiayiivirga sp.]